MNIVFNESCQRENSQIPTWKQPNYLVDKAFNRTLKKKNTKYYL